MGRGIQSWMTLLAKSGTTKQKSQSRTRIRHTRGRKLRFENCEDRRMLATFTVNVDYDATAPFDFTDNDVSLREAIERANNVSPGPDTINFAASLDGQTILLTNGEMLITESLTINGLGRDDLTIDAQGNSQIFEINDGVFGAGAVVQDVKISGLTLVVTQCLPFLGTPTAKHHIPCRTRQVPPRRCVARPIRTWIQTRRNRRTCGPLPIAAGLALRGGCAAVARCVDISASGETVSRSAAARNERLQQPTGNDSISQKGKSQVGKRRPNDSSASQLGFVALAV